MDPSPRPLPALTDLNRFFWTSGAEGVLRFQRCTGCGALRHVPVPVCSNCFGFGWEPADVSGRAVVVALTVNEHEWIPTMPPPYVIAIVAIEEDNRIRLTTNLVNCAPEDAFVGMKVQVVFEQHEDVWLPLFEPTGEPESGPIPAEDPTIRQVRPMVRQDKFEEKVAITGAGMSEVGRRLGRHPVELAVEASLRAIEDAGLGFEDIDGICTYPGAAAAAGITEGGVYPVADALRIRPTWHNGAGQTPGLSGSLVSAMLAVASGLCEHVLCYRTLTEATATARARSENPGTKATGLSRTLGAYAGARLDDDFSMWRLPFGAASAANWIGMTATTHMKLYGTTRETLGWIALNDRANAAKNPTAIYRDPLTMDDYLSARLISTPFGLYDCDVPMDGSIAIIVSRRDVAGGLRQPPVHVEAIGSQFTERVSWDQGVVDHEQLVIGASKHLWSRTDLTTADMDFAQIYDGFTFNCLSWIEALGFCETGEAKDFLHLGTNIAPDGTIPLNTHGGQLSAGRLHGFGFVHEAIMQLRGQAGERQLPHAEVGVVTTGGGGASPGGAMVLTRAR
jgi:acetyl-CoA acetyltransferase/uncharacterized OB-fold protein